jgi:hypothetical protein
VRVLHPAVIIGGVRNAVLFTHPRDPSSAGCFYADSISHVRPGGRAHTRRAPYPRAESAARAGVDRGTPGSPPLSVASLPLIQLWQPGASALGGSTWLGSLSLLALSGVQIGTLLRGAARVRATAARVSH